MKTFRNAIILVVILGLLAGAYFYLNNKKAGEDNSSDGPPDEDEILVISSEKDKINSIEFNNDSGHFKVYKKDSENWAIEPEMEFPLSNETVNAAASDFSSVVANKIIEEKASDLSKYGLDKPRATVKVGLSDGTFKEVEVGNETPTSDGIYVKNKTDDKVYVVGTYYRSKFQFSRSYFAVKDILPVEADKIKKVTYEKNGELQFALNIKSETEAELTAPIKEEAEISEASKITAAVVKLTVKDIVDENPDLAKYGLDKPAYSIEYSDDTTTKKILFGNELEKGKIAYAKYPDSKSVFTIDISPLTFLDTKFSNLVSTFVFLPNIKDVNKVELTIDGKTIVSEIYTDKEDSSKDTFKVDGKDANMENESGNSLFRAFYSAMIGITMNKYEPGHNPSGTPEVTIKYYMKPDSKPVTIEYIPKDEHYYYAMKNGVYTNRIVLKSKLDEVDGVRETYKTLKEAIDKAEAEKGASNGTGNDASKDTNK